MMTNADYRFVFWKWVLCWCAPTYEGRWLVMQQLYARDIGQG